MDGSDRNKLIKAGFRVMRASKDSGKITELNRTGGWVLVMTCNTFAALKKAVKDLRTDDKIIFETAE